MVMPDTFAGQCKFERAKRGDTIVGAVEKAREEARRGGVEVGDGGSGDGTGLRQRERNTGWGGSPVPQCSAGIGLDFEWTEIFRHHYLSDI